MLNPYIDGRGTPILGRPGAFGLCGRTGKSTGCLGLFGARSGAARLVRAKPVDVGFGLWRFGLDLRQCDDGAANTNSQLYGFATGVDYQALPNTTFGLALGGGGTA
jgi:hypothetical protein